MKLLYITNSISGAGGLERVLALKASYLADHMDYEVHMLTLNERNAPLFYEFSPKLICHDITVSGNPVSYVLQYIRGIRKAVHDIQPDIISVCDDGLKGFFLPLILRHHCPMIYERHVSKLIALPPDAGFLKRQLTGLKFWLMDKLAESFDKFVVLTPDNLQEWELTNTAVIANPLSFYPDTPGALTAGKVIAVGKQSYQKGFDRLLKSWQHVQAAHPEWKLEIYGKFDAAQDLPGLAESLGIEKTVSFFEAAKDIQEKYISASVFVLSSRFEGFGMVLIEAMACGLPCVSFDCPCGPKDIIRQGTDGFLVENGNTARFAEKINLLIDDQDLRSSMGNAARENVQRYLLPHIMPKWDSLFKSLKS